MGVGGVWSWDRTLACPLALPSVTPRAGMVAHEHGSLVVTVRFRHGPRSTENLIHSVDYRKPCVAVVLQFGDWG